MGGGERNGENISELKPSAQGTHSLGATDCWKSASPSPKRPGPEGQIWGQLLNHRGRQDQLEESPLWSPGKHLMLKEEGEDQRPRQEMARERVSGRRQCQADKRQKTSS